MKLAFDTACLGRDSVNSVTERVAMCLGKSLQEELAASGDEMELLVYAVNSVRLPELRQEFPYTEIRHIYTMPLSLHTLDDARDAILYTSKLLVEDVYSHLDADVVFVPSLFPILAENVLPRDYNKCSSQMVVAFFHDSDTMLIKESIFSSDEMRQWHQAGAERARSCDLLLASSEYGRKELIDVFGIDPAKIIVVGSNTEHGFVRGDNSENEKKSGRQVKSANEQQCSWDRIAEMVLDSIRGRLAIFCKGLVGNSPKLTSQEWKPRIAWVTSRLETADAEIIDCRSDILPLLDAHFSLDIYLAQEPDRVQKAEYARPLKSWEDLPDRADAYDLLVYDLSGGECMAFMLPLLEAHPGLVIMRDFRLGSILSWVSAHEPGMDGLLRENVIYSHGWHGVAELDRLGEINFTRIFPINKKVLDCSLGVILKDEKDWQMVARFYGTDYVAWLSPAVIDESKPGQDAADIAAEYVAQIERGIFRKAQAGIDYFLQEMGEGLRGFSISHEDYIAVADCYMKNHPYPVWRRAYICLPDESFAELQAAEPDELKQEPLRELVQCTWDAGTGNFIVCMQSSCQKEAVRFQPEDCLLLDRRLLSEEQVAAVACTLASVYVVCDAREYGKLDTSVGKWLTGFVSPAALRDFYALPWSAGQPEKGDNSRLLVVCSPCSQIQEREEFQRFYDSVVSILTASDLQMTMVRMSLGRLETYHAYAADLIENQDARSFVAREHYISFRPGDKLLLLDTGYGMSFAQSTQDGISSWQKVLRDLHRAGGQAIGVLGDMFLLEHPQFLPTEVARTFYRQRSEMLMCECDGLICFSKTAADKAIDYLNRKLLPLPSPTRLYCLPLVTTCLSEVGQVRKKLRDFFKTELPVFMMAGTVEPCKCYATALWGFRRFLEQGGEARLLIIGRYGWIDEGIVELVRESQEHGNLLCLHDASASELSYSYRHATCYLNTSVDEAFATSMREAALYGLPLLCSDIPLYHEIAEERAEFFKPNDVEALCAALHAWLAAASHPDSTAVRFYNSQESSDCILGIMQGVQEPYRMLQ